MLNPRNNITIEKGSITVNGVSLTVVDEKISLALPLSTCRPV
jgi:riboflavin synthase alpha subunit